MIPPSWPFAVWGVDILGPFPRAIGKYCFLFIAIDKFTKWPEATPVVNITQSVAVAFLKSIVCRFGVPNRVITDNGTQFRSRLFKEYCEGIKPHPAELPRRPRSSWSSGPKPAFTWKSLWAPYGFSRLMSLCRNGYGVRMWTSSTNADGKRRFEMHGTTKRSGATTSGLCIVGSSGSGTWS
jgi:hypothetical protein